MCENVQKYCTLMDPKSNPIPKYFLFLDPRWKLALSLRHPWSTSQHFSLRIKEILCNNMLTFIIPRIAKVRSLIKKIGGEANWGFPPFTSLVLRIFYAADIKDSSTSRWHRPPLGEFVLPYGKMASQLFVAKLALRYIFISPTREVGPQRCTPQTGHMGNWPPFWDSSSTTDLRSRYQRFSVIVKKYI